jgi:hypothetical protein
LLLTLLNPLDVAGTYSALSPLSVAAPGDRYTDRALQTSLLFLSAMGVLRLSHVNDQPIASWGMVLGTARRPDADTLDQYLRALQTQEARAMSPDDASGPACEYAPAPVGQVCPDGLIAQAQSRALTEWAQAGLFQDPVWYFDGHTIEYTGQARIGKTLHGTKHISVQAVDEYCLFNHLPGLTCYFPTSVSYEQALRQMLTQAQAALPPDRRIRQLAFDKEGWNASLLEWLVAQDIIPLTWVKETTTNRALLAGLDPQVFVDLDDEVTVGKSDQEHRVVRVADVDVTFPDLGTRRVVVLETDAGTRLGIFTTALRPTDAPLDNERVMPTLAVLNTMHHKQRIENSFKVRQHEMDTDALPTHQVHQVVQTEPYDLQKAQAQAARADQRLDKYQADQDRHAELLENGEIDQREFKTLTARTARLQTKTHHRKDRLSQDLARVTTDAATGQTVIERTVEVLDVRKLALLNLFKDHALVVLHLLAHLLGLEGAGPERLRREFFAHGDRIEFDHAGRVMTVYTKPFPRARTQLAYEQLCAQLNERPVTFARDGRTYRVRFSW